MQKPTGVSKRSIAARVALVALALVAFGGCSAGGAGGASGGAATGSATSPGAASPGSTSPGSTSPGSATAAAGGMIELAVAQVCAAGSSPECVPVADEYVALPSTFDRATVVDAAVADGQDAVEVTFTAEGAAVLHDLSEEAVRQGPAARLVLRIGGEPRAAVVVLQALDGESLQIALPSDEDAQSVVDAIRAG